MKKRGFLFVLAILPFILVAPAIRSEGSQDDEKAGKAKHSSTRDDEQKRNQRTPENGSEWFGRAYELHQSDRYREAIEAFKKAIELDYRKATAMYNIACGYAMLDDSNNALSWLEQSLAAGFTSVSHLFDDSDLDSIRSHPGFRNLLKQISASSGEDTAKRDRLEDASLRFEQLQQAASQDGEAWHQVGSKLLRCRDTARSIIALTQATEHLGYDNDSAMYNLACAYALSGNRESAFQWLEKAVEAGFSDSDGFSRDRDLVSLHAEARLKAIEEKSRLLAISRFYKGDFEGPLYSKKNWAPAIALYESFLAREPDSGRGWFNLGYALHYSFDHAKAIVAFARAFQLGYRKPTTMYNLACAQAMSGNGEMALDWLEKSFAAGFKLANYIHSDKDLDSLRRDSRFKALQEKVEVKHRGEKKH